MCPGYFPEQTFKHPVGAFLANRQFIFIGKRIRHRRDIVFDAVEYVEQQNEALCLFVADSCRFDKLSAGVSRTREQGHVRTFSDLFVAGITVRLKMSLEGFK